jgi:hypothetical protein
MFRVRTSVAFRLVAARLDTAVNAPRALQLRTIPSELNQIGLAGGRLTRLSISHKMLCFERPKRAAIKRLVRARTSAAEKTDDSNDKTQSGERGHTLPKLCAVYVATLTQVIR